MNRFVYVLFQCSGGSSSDGSSCEEGRLKSVRPLTTLNALRQGVVSSDPDVSSSEQSCDTVIYVGPGGVALSDKELTDNEGPPSIVPIPQKPPVTKLLLKPAESRTLSTRNGEAKQFGPQMSRPVLKPQPSLTPQASRTSVIPRSSLTLQSKHDGFARTCTGVTRPAAWNKVPFRENRATKEQWVDGPREQWVDGPGDAQPNMTWADRPSEAAQRVAGEQWVDGPGAPMVTTQKEQWIDGPALEQELEHTKAGRTEQWVSMHTGSSPQHSSSTVAVPPAQAEEVWIDEQLLLQKETEEVWLDATPHNTNVEPSHPTCLSVSDTMTDSTSDVLLDGTDSSDPLSALSAENVKLDTINEGSSVDPSDFGDDHSDIHQFDTYMDDDLICENEDHIGKIKLDIGEHSDSHSIMSFGSEQKDRLIDERLAGYEGMAQIGSSISSLGIRSSGQSGSDRSRSESPRLQKLTNTREKGSFDFDKELQEIEKVLATVTLEKQERHIVKAVNGFARDANSGRQRSPPLSSRAGSEEKPTQIVSPILSDKSDKDEKEKSLDELDNDEDIWKKVDEVLSSCEEEADTMRAEAWKLSFDISKRKSVGSNIGCETVQQSDLASQEHAALSEKLSEDVADHKLEKVSPVRPSSLRHPDGASNPNLSKHPSVDELLGILDAETEKELRSTLSTILPDQNKPKVVPAYNKTVVAHASVSYNHSLNGSPKRDIAKTANGNLKTGVDSMQETKKSQVSDKPATAPKPTVLPKPSVPQKSSPKSSPKPSRSSIPKPSTLPKLIGKTDTSPCQGALECKPSTLDRSNRTSNRSKSETRSKILDVRVQSPPTASTPTSSSTSFFGLKSSAKQSNKSKLPQTSKSSTKPDKQKSEKSKTEKSEKKDKPRFSLSRKDSKGKTKMSNNRVAELNGSRGSMAHTDYDSGNDSGVVAVEKQSSLLSPYSTVTKPRSASHSSSGHGSDNSSVLSGDMTSNSPKHVAVKLRAGKLQAGGTSSGYESMLRDSEGSGSSTSAHESASEGSGTRSRGVRLFKKKLQGMSRA